MGGRLIKYSVIIMAIALLHGCDNSKDHRASDEVKFVYDDVKMVDVRLKLARQMSPKIDDSAAAALKRELIENFRDKVVQDGAIRLYAKENGIDIPAENVSNFLVRICGGEKKYRSFFEKLTDEERHIAYQLVEADCLFTAVREKVLKEAQISVEGDEVDFHVKKIQSYNEMASATNALIYAQATNCWNRITSGELTFFEAAKQYDQSNLSEDEQYYWGDFPLNALTEDVGLVTQLTNMKKGEVTPPVEADNALLIVYFDGITQNEKQSDVLAPEAYYQLRRIVFRLPVLYDEPTPEVVEKELLKLKTSEYFNDFLTSLCSRFKSIGSN